MMDRSRLKPWQASRCEVLINALLVLSHAVVMAVTEDTPGQSYSGSFSSKVVIGKMITVWGASYGSDTGKDFQFAIGDTDGASDRTWLSNINNLYQGEVICGSSDRSKTFLFPIAHYQLCVNVNSKAGAYIKVPVTSFAQVGGAGKVPLYVEVNANGLATDTDAKQAIIFTENVYFDNINSKTVLRFDDTAFSGVGAIDHATDMAPINWKSTGKDGSTLYTNMTKSDGTSFIHLDHFKTIPSSGGYSLARDVTRTASSTDFRYDSTEFNGVDACPTEARIDVTVYMDLACLLTAPGAGYAGTVEVDFKTESS